MNQSFHYEVQISKRLLFGKQKDEKRNKEDKKNCKKKIFKTQARKNKIND